MNMNTKAITLLLAVGALASAAAARDFEYQGIWYTVLDEDAKTCETRAGKPSDDGNSILDSFITGNSGGESNQTIPSSVMDGNTSYTVTAIGKGSFYKNNMIEVIDLPNSLISIGDSAFFGSDIRAFSIPASVEYIGKRAFGETTRKESFSVDADNQHYLLEDNILYNKDKSTLIEYFGHESELTLPSTVKRIEDYAFYGCGLQQIDLGESVAEIGESAFERCYSLTSVDLGESLAGIGNNAFMYCYGLENINIPTSVTKIGASAFNNCSSLTGIEIPNSLSVISDNAFNSCRSLTTVVIPNSVTTIGSSAFNSCAALTELVIPNSVTEIGQAAFAGCSRLTSVKIPNSITYIKRSTFGDCENLAEVEIPNSVTGIGQFAFSGCKSLTSIVIPESVKVIEEAAFEIDHGESALTDITLPSTLTELGEYVFSGQDNVRNVYYGAAEPIRAYFSSFSEKCYKDAVLHVAAEAVDKIKSTVPWSLFANIEQSGIEEVEAVAAAADGEVYTLQGVRAAKPLKPGVYIGNGRKIIVK